MIEEQLKENFQALCKEVEETLAKSINDIDLVSELGEPTPLATFIKEVRKICGVMLISKVKKIKAGPKPSMDSDIQFIEELIAEREKEGKTFTASRAKKVTEELSGKYSKLPIAQEFFRNVRLTDFDRAADAYIQKRSHREWVGNQAGLSSLQRHNPSWDRLVRAISESAEDDACSCSLIYSYWLDEGGLHFALERIADRIENGITATTAPLRMLHVAEGEPENSPIVDALGSFIISWQRGETFDVDARRKQYYALYGYPLHAAKSWGTLNTNDPRVSFPGAFNRLVYEASRYYEATRDLQRIPDTAPARAAISQLLDALKEGNENFRKKRTSEIRGQSEYCKRLLGGSDPSTDFARTWRQYMAGRPGMESDSVWSNKVDAVASAYRWARPRMKEYIALAESSESLLVATRAAGDAVANGDAQLTQAFLGLIEAQVQRYVNSFKVVGGVDLSGKLVTEPPAAVFGTRINPPPIPPLKREWGVRTPEASPTVS